ncbi:MAG TPA: hypothetical protein VLI90_18960, partial [Tepidisphaeraceae bacterium]|nr:hypothetical protein [Tepidisphaeraceae bacterium]
MSDRTEHGPPDLISVARAIQILDDVTVTPRVQRVRLADAQGLRLADQISSDRDYPPFDKSVMDGYAVRAADVTSAGVELRVVETIAAGASAQRSLAAGEAIA